ncbi:MAG: hypothetical protein HYT29_01615 [Parcubacteria group bacterium]|nr:hypothetical protein [Parcubacteria group bacterium]
MRKAIVLWLTTLAIFSPPLFSEGQIRRTETGANPTEKLIGPVVFHWFTANSGQWTSPWIPIEGRRAWDGGVDFWKSQERLMRQAGFNMELFQVSYHNDLQQKNHLLAISDNRRKMLSTPKIVPFFESASFLSYSEEKDLRTARGREDFYQVIKKWFEMYLEVFYGAQSSGRLLDASQLASIDRKVLVAVWYVPLKDNYVPSDFFRYLSGELLLDFGFEAFWSVHPNWISGGPDEINYLFTGPEPVQRSGRGADLLVGFWPPDRSYPSRRFLPRNNAESYKAGWDEIIAHKDSIDRVYVESWNEYAEGSGMYPAVPMSHFLKDGHLSSTPDARCWTEPCHQVQERDSWGDSPWLYIDITRQKIWELYGGSKDVDAVSPHVLIVPPVQYDTLRQKIKVNVLLGDNVAVTQLDVELDGVFCQRIAPGDQKGVSLTIDAGSLSEGRHSIQTKVKDAAGNSDEYSIAVNITR